MAGLESFGWAVSGSAPAAGPLAVCMLAGFVVGAAGHLYRSRATVIVGIIVILVTTAVFVAATDPGLGG